METTPHPTIEGRTTTGQLAKGTSGNPNGRPKGQVSIVKALRKHLEAHPEDQEAIATKVVEQAIQGSLGHQSMVVDRMDGPLQQDIMVGVRQIDEGVALEERPRPKALPIGRVVEQQLGAPDTSEHQGVQSETEHQEEEQG